MSCWGWGGCGSEALACCAGMSSAADRIHWELAVLLRRVGVVPVWCSRALCETVQEAACPSFVVLCWRAPLSRRCLWPTSCCYAAAAMLLLSGHSVCCWHVSLHYSARVPGVYVLLLQLLLFHPSTVALASFSMQHEFLVAYCWPACGFFSCLWAAWFWHACTV